MNAMEKAKIALRKYLLANKEQVKKDLEEMRKKSKPDVSDGYRRELLLDFAYWWFDDLHPADAHNLINKYDKHNNFRKH